MELREAKEALKAVTNHAITEYYKRNPKLIVSSSRKVIATGKGLIATDGKKLGDFDSTEVQLVHVSDTSGFGKSAAVFEAEADGIQYNFLFASTLSTTEIITNYVMNFED